MEHDPMVSHEGSVVPMKIGIELRYVTLGNSGGISQLLQGVLQALFAQHPNVEFVVFCTIFSRNLLEDTPEHVEVLSLPSVGFFAQLDRIAGEKKLNILFRSYPSEDNLIFPFAKQVFLLPDIQHEFYPEFFTHETLRARRAAFNRAMAAAGAIGTLSEYARQTILEHEWTICQDVFLVSPALQDKHREHVIAELTGEEQALIPTEAFFLYPANLWPHKNHRRVLQAFDRFLKQTGQRMIFILTGHPSGWAELHQEFPALPVQHLGFVRPQLLRQLFKRAQALAFFSMYEGFGMPLLEAFNAETPVICSNTTSLPEVGGDAVLMCDPTNVQAMSDLMVCVTRDDALCATLIARGKQRLQIYNWEQSAQNLYAAFQRVYQATQAEIPSVQVWEAIKNAPLVSIVTPSYNQGRFLKRTIESVLNQTYPHIEYIVIDGGSHDESVDILKSYGDRIVWVSEPDNGQTDAINKGFTQSHGEIRAYLNSDDVLQLDAVEKVVAYFQQHPECDLMYGKAYYIDKDDRITGKYKTAEYSFRRLMRDCPICQPATFWRTRIAKLVGPFNEQLNYAMDYEYWLRVDRAGGRIEHTLDILASSRLYPETKTLTAREKIYEEVFEICQAHGGYVDLNYFHGLWHQRVCRSNTGWPRYVRWLPRGRQMLAHLHHKWYYRRTYTPRHVLRLLYHQLRRRRTSRFKLVDQFYKLVGVLSFKIGWRKPASGFWPDRWLGPSCCVMLKQVPPGQTFYLIGKASATMVLRVKLQGRMLGKYQLQANTYQNISFQVEPGTNQRILLKFSRYIVDPAHRPLSFMLEQTNLFSEHDTF
jgi:glycosyltransferase involved in cell wall biosynthesis